MAKRLLRQDSKPIRVSTKTHETLVRLAKTFDLPITAVVEKAAEELQRQTFFAQLHEGYTKLQQDPDAWTAYRHEAAEWDVTLADGMAPGE
jgi:hypothetical protein